MNDTNAGKKTTNIRMNMTRYTTLGTDGQETQVTLLLSRESESQRDAEWLNLHGVDDIRLVRDFCTEALRILKAEL